MANTLLKELPALVNAQVITPEVAHDIQVYYAGRNQKTGSNLLTIFSLLGAILVGLGIILIIAHNWDNLGRAARTAFAFMPLVMGQLLGLYTLLRKPASRAWQEGTGAFIFLAVGACLSLVSQTYHLSGEFSTFLLTWLLLGLPALYLLQSSVVSLFYIAGISAYAGLTHYTSFLGTGAYEYWGLLVLVLPHYYRLYRIKPKSLFLDWHHWFIPLSVLYVFAIMPNQNSFIKSVALMSLFNLFYLIGTSAVFKQRKALNNAYQVIGTLGILFTLLLLTISPHWEYNNLAINLIPSFSTPVFIIGSAFFLGSLALWVMRYQNRSFLATDPLEITFIAFLVISITGLFTSKPALVLLNGLIVFIGGYYIIAGVKQQHLGWLNLGLLTITALIACRFFDTDLTFITRGLLFVLVGSGLFLFNYRILQKRKSHEN